MDYLIIGSGIVGLTIAREIQLQEKNSKILIIEKEDRIGQHASGRNSGVLHSGIYYEKNSLKAKFTKEGNKLWKEYCSYRNIKIDNCGKLIVPTSDQDSENLKILKTRAKENNIDFEELDQKQVSEIERKIKYFDKTLFIKSTTTVNPVDILKKLLHEYIECGGAIHFSQEFKFLRKESVIKVNGEQIEAGFVINAAGLYADKIAKQFGFSAKHTLLPFKGLYLHSNTLKINSHVYPVPDLRYPFLGVHMTKTLDGYGKIGPTAIPAFWRENYSGFKRFKLSEFLNISLREIGLILSNKNFRDLSKQEIWKFNKKRLINEVSKMIKISHEDQFNYSLKPGIRAQLVNTDSGELVMDFLVEGNNKSVHILNAISPAFTSAIPFAKYILKNYVWK